MEQRCSGLSAKGMCIAVCASIVLLGCAGCGKPPTFHIVAQDDQAFENSQYKIFLKGRELGTVTGKGRFEFDAEGLKGKTPEDMLPQGIEVKIPWDCGWVNTDFSFSRPNSDEIDRARSEHRPVPATMHLSYMPPSFEWVTIFVDNRGGPPQTVSIGELKEQVPAGAAQRVLLEHTGGCDMAKDVRLNGQVVAPVNTHQTLLIDIAQSHCYRTEWANYGQPGAGEGKTIYRPRPFQFLETNPDTFMEGLPGSVQSTVGVESRETLKDVACPKS